MIRANYKRLVLLITIVVIASVMLIMRFWLGPKVSGYTVQLMPLVQNVVATGRLTSVSRVQIGSEITGVVSQRRVQEGDLVAAGDTLLRLRAEDMEAEVRQAEAALDKLALTTRPYAEAELEIAEFELEQASLELERRRRLFERSMISSEALEQAQQIEKLARNTLASARLKFESFSEGGTEEHLLKEKLLALKAQLAKTVVRSEVAGTILTCDVEPGDLVQPGHVLFTLAREGKTEVIVPVDERNLALLAVGQPATVIADAYPTEPFTAHVRMISPSVDSERGTVQVYLSLDSKPDFLRQDMTVSVNIETGYREQAISIPNDALGDIQGQKAFVLVVRQGRLHKQEVNLGLRGLVRSEVLLGLEVGDMVAADPLLSIEEGARVQFSEQLQVTVEKVSDNDSRNESLVDFN